MQITGVIKQVLPPQSGTSKRTGNPWVAQQFVIEEQGVQFPQSVLFQVFGQDKIQQFALQVGRVVTVSFSMRVREYNGKMYNDTPNAYAVQPAQPQMGQYQPIPQQAQQQAQQVSPSGQQQGQYQPQYGQYQPNPRPF